MGQVGRLFVIITLLTSGFPVVNGINVINCTVGCERNHDFTEPSNLRISMRFQCPSECMCTLGSHKITVGYPNGSASVLPVLYPPNFLNLIENDPDNDTISGEDYELSESSSWSSYSSISGEDYGLIALSWGNAGLHEIMPNAFLESNHTNFNTSFHAFNWNKLYWLDISFNYITKLHPQLFEGLTNLKTLHLSSNNFMVLQPFQGLAILTELVMNNNNIAKPHPQLFEEIYALVSLCLHNNNITELHAHQFQGLTNLRYLDLAKNKISELHLQLFKDLPNLTWLFLSYNTIVKLHAYQFQGNPKLTYLYLGNNNIVELHPQSFEGLSGLYDLTMSNNNIVKLHEYQFQWLNIKLDLLDLSDNDIVEIHLRQFEALVYLTVIDLSNNRIKEICSQVLQPLTRLQYLNLSSNNLVLFQLPKSVKYHSLQYISVSNNKLSDFPRGILQNVLNLKYLDISKNMLNDFDTGLYFMNNSMAFLDIVNLRGNELRDIHYGSFRYVPSKTNTMVDNAATCCFINSANCTGTTPSSQFLTCGRLLSNPIQRITMWILGIFAIITNAGVLFYRYMQSNDTTVQLLLISNLSISDLCMGMYMLVIASADIYYANLGHFPSEAWRTSITCKAAGTLSFLSSEASIFFVSLLSVDRLMGIRYTFSTKRLGTYSVKVVIAVIWVFTVILSLFATILSVIDPDLYDVSEVCTGLPLSRSNVIETGYRQYDGIRAGDGSYLIIPYTFDTIINTKPGMYFGIAIFSIINLICMLVITFCYIGIFITVRQSAIESGRDQTRNEEFRMAMKMGVIVLTDMMCWLPIIILSIVVQSGGMTVTPHTYTWIVTFVLPINSAINPFLYSLATAINECVQKTTQTISNRAVE